MKKMVVEMYEFDGWNTFELKSKCEVDFTIDNLEKWVKHITISDYDRAIIKVNDIVIFEYDSIKGICYDDVLSIVFDLMSDDDLIDFLTSDINSLCDD